MSYLAHVLAAGRLVCVLLVEFLQALLQPLHNGGLHEQARVVQVQDDKALVGGLAVVQA